MAHTNASRNGSRDKPPPRLLIFRVAQAYPRAAAEAMKTPYQRKEKAPIENTSGCIYPSTTTDSPGAGTRTRAKWAAAASKAAPLSPICGKVP